MASAEEIRQWMLRVMSERELSPAAWARMAGVAASTVQRAIKPDYAFVTSNRTLSRLASAVNVESPNTGTQPRVEKPTFLRIRYEVGAGVWRMVSDIEQVDYGSAPVLADPAYAQFPQWLERVVGDSMDQEYLPGSLLHVISTADLGYAARPGDHVIVERRRDQGGTVERTVKEIAFGPHGMTLISRSNNPRWGNHPVVVTAEGYDQDHCTVEIVGLVVGSYRSRRNAL